MIRDLVKAYFKILISGGENKNEKISLLNQLSKFLLNKNNIQEALEEFNRKYINLYIHATSLNINDIILSYEVYEKNEIADLLKKDLIYYISDLLIQNDNIGVNNFIDLLINLSKKTKINNIKDEISINDFLNVFQAENNIYINVFGDSGTGKTITTFFISYLMNNYNFYFTDFNDFKNFVKDSIKNDKSLIIRALVFDELKAFGENEIKILNRIRYFNYNQEPIVIFVITHEKNEFKQLKNQISLYAYFYKKQHLRIYKRKYMIRSKLRVLFPSLYKPVLKNYLLNNVYFNFSSNLLKQIKNIIYNYEYNAKKNIILNLLE